MNNVNYSKELEKIIAVQKEEGRCPSLLLQACCAPCSSYCLEYLREHFRVTVFFYNPNISQREEYEKRKEEEKRLIFLYNKQVEEQNFAGMNSTQSAKRIEILDCDYDKDSFDRAVQGLEHCPEGGDRCTECFRLRLSRTAKEARERGFDYFSTTLTISPLKDAGRLNAIGMEEAEKYKVAFLPSDFKKKNGYKRSIELSHQFDLYRQNYCGCAYSKLEQEQRTKKHETID